MWFFEHNGFQVKNPEDLVEHDKSDQWLEYQNPEDGRRWFWNKVHQDMWFFRDTGRQDRRQPRRTVRFEDETHQ